MSPTPKKKQCGCTRSTNSRVAGSSTLHLDILTTNTRTQIVLALKHFKTNTRTQTLALEHLTANTRTQTLQDKHSHSNTWRQTLALKHCKANTWAPGLPVDREWCRLTGVSRRGSAVAALPCLEALDLGRLGRRLEAVGHPLLRLWVRATRSLLLVDLLALGLGSVGLGPGLGYCALSLVVLLHVGLLLVVFLHVVVPGLLLGLQIIFIRMGTDSKTRDVE